MNIFKGDTPIYFSSDQRLLILLVPPTFLLFVLFDSAAFQGVSHCKEFYALYIYLSKSKMQKTFKQHLHHMI